MAERNEGMKEWLSINIIHSPVVSSIFWCRNTFRFWFVGSSEKLPLGNIFHSDVNQTGSRRTPKWGTTHLNGKFIWELNKNNNLHECGHLEHCIVVCPHHYGWWTGTGVLEWNLVPIVQLLSARWIQGRSFLYHYPNSVAGSCLRPSIAPCESLDTTKSRSLRCHTGFLPAHLNKSN